MGFNHQKYNATYLQSTQPINDAAEKYGVAIEKADVEVGRKYWKVIGVHHLLPLENMSNHHVYVDVLDADGKRVRNPSSWLGWTWKDRQAREPARPIIVDKPDNEPGTNIAIGKNQIISIWIQGRQAAGTDKSDKVTNIRTTHPDEPLSDGSLHNTWGHHSFYVVFQETTKTASDQSSSNQDTTNPQTGNPQTGDPQTDGSQQEDPQTPTTPDNLIDHYVLFGPTKEQRINLFIAMDYIVHFSLSAGFNVELAKRANKVTIIGEGIDANTVEAIRQSQTEVEQLSSTGSTLEDILKQRIAANKAFKI